jgi:hypothetical protein
LALAGEHLPMPAPLVAHSSSWVNA